MIEELSDRFRISQSARRDSGASEILCSKATPRIEFSQWDREAQFGCAYVHPMEPGRTLGGVDRIVWKGMGEELHAYALASGDFEIEIILLRRPATNVFDFAIDGAADLDFFYQPSMVEEVDGVEIFSATEMQGFDKAGQLVAERPAHIVGSYAVYHKTKRNHVVGQLDYAAGKLYHIHRPKVTDANGFETWATLSYLDGVLRVTVPQAFLDGATYPVRVDPTFGYTTAGGTAFPGVGNTTVKIANMVNQRTAVSGDTVTSYSVYIISTGVNNQLVAMTTYSVTGGSPDARLAARTTIATFTTVAWRTSAAVSQALTAGVVYCAAIGFQDLGAGEQETIYYDSGSAPGRINSTVVAMDDPFSPTGTDSGRHYSWYATYTAGSAGPTYPRLERGIRGLERGLAIGAN